VSSAPSLGRAPRAPVTVLVTAAGSAPAQAFIRGLRDQRELSVRLVGVDMVAHSSGLFDCERRYTVPRVEEEPFMEAIKAICAAESVSVLVPIANFELRIFAEAAEWLLAELGVRVITNSPAAVELASDKRASADTVARCGVPVPAIHETADLEGLAYPVIVKPTSGAGSQGVSVVASSRQLHAALQAAGAAPLVQDFIEGQEYTTDMVIAPDGEILAAAPRIRLEVRAGQSYKGVTVEDPEIAETARRCAAAIGMTGQGNVQLIRSKHDRRCYFVEVNPKFAAAMGLTIGAGLNLPLLYVKLALGLPVCPGELVYEPNVWLLRSWQDRVVRAREVDRIPRWQDAGVALP